MLLDQIRVFTLKQQRYIGFVRLIDTILFVSDTILFVRFIDTILFVSDTILLDTRTINHSATKHDKNQKAILKKR